MAVDNASDLLDVVIGCRLILADNALDHAKLIQILCRHLHDLRRLAGSLGIFPQNRSKALRRKDRVGRILHHPYLVGNRQRQCAAAAALTGDNRQNRHLHIRHLKEVAGNRLALASLLCLHTRECTWRIDKTDDRTVKFRRLFHQTERLSVSFRRRHAEVVLHAVFRGFTSLLSNDRDRHSIERCHTADDRHIIAIIPVAVELGKIVKQDPDIIAGVQTSGATGLAYCLPGVSLSTCDLI